MQLIIRNAGSYQADDFASFTFTASGGSIGRGADSHCILPTDDLRVSRKHASIEYRQGQYYLQDLSANGTFINDNVLPVGQGNSVSLAPGDLIRIGEFQFEVSLVQDEILQDQDEVDPLKVIGKNTALPEQAAGIPKQWWDDDPVEHTSLLAIPETMSSEAALAEVTTAGTIHTTETNTTATSATSTHTTETAITATTVDFENFLKTLGVDSGTDHNPALYARVFRIITQGLIEALQARDKIRNQLRVQKGTQIQPLGNNPLKFSINADDALHNLFVKQGRGFLPPDIAYEQAFLDINIHQYALIQGMRAAFESMLEQFSPQSLMKKMGHAEKDRRSALLAFFSREEDLWTKYCAYYESLAQDRDHWFQTLFGEPFSQAYESAGV